MGKLAMNSQPVYWTALLRLDVGCLRLQIRCAFNRTKGSEATVASEVINSDGRAAIRSMRCFAGNEALVVMVAVVRGFPLLVSSVIRFG
jgi:hypothetical protein